MSSHSSLRLAFAFAVLFFGARVASAQTPDLSEERLVEVLTSDAPNVEKSLACRMLRVKGTEKSVPALAELLTDENLSHAARVALEPMPYESAGEALRSALEKTEGLARVGIITSLGNRRDEEAVPIIAPLLKSDDSVTRDAVLFALTKIATREAEFPIEAARSAANEEFRSKLDQALLIMVDRRQERGDRFPPVNAFYQLTVEGDTSYAVAAAILRWQLGLPGRHDMFSSTLRSDDVNFRRAGASQLAALKAEELKLVAESFTDFPPDSQVALLAAIRIRRIAQALPHVLEAAKSDSPEVKLAALRALGQIGDRTALPLLIEHAFGDGPTRDAAREALTRIHAQGVDDELTKRLKAETDPARRARWLDLLVARNAAGIAELLLAEATHDSPAVRQPAMAALARVASPSHLPAMTKAVLAAEPGAERDAAEKSVMLVAQQTTDPTKRGAELLELYRQATPADQQALLPLLGRIGGDGAKQTILAIVNSDDADEARREAAIRALSNWPDPSVADELRQLAEQSKTPRHRQWALRALIRVVSLPDALPDDQRLAELKRAFELAQRDDERRLALDRMASVRTIESLRTLVPYLDNSELSASAAKSIAELARHTHLRNPHKEEFASALERVIAAETTDEATRVQASRHLQAARQ